MFFLIIIENNLITIMMLLLEFMERDLYNLKLKKKKKKKKPFQKDDIKMIRKIIILK